MTAAAIASVACTISGAHDVGQDVAQRDAQVRVADRARRLDVVLDLDREHLRARQPDEHRRRRDADRDHRVGEARAEERGERDREDQERAGEHRVGDARDQRRRPSRRRSPRAGRSARRAKARSHTDTTPASSDARVPQMTRDSDVAADLVGAEQVCIALGALRIALQLACERIVRRDPWREQRRAGRKTRRRPARPAHRARRMKRRSARWPGVSSRVDRKVGGDRQPSRSSRASAD